MKELKWTTVVHYVDEDGGEIITRHNATMNYHIINQIKETKFNNGNYETSTSGEITRYNICRASRQIKLYGTDT